MTENELMHEIVLNRHIIEELNHKLEKARNLLNEWKNNSKSMVTSYILRLETDKFLNNAL